MPADLDNISIVGATIHTRLGRINSICLYVRCHNPLILEWIPKYPLYAIKIRIKKKRVERNGKIPFRKIRDKDDSF